MSKSMKMPVMAADQGAGQGGPRPGGAGPRPGGPPGGGMNPSAMGFGPRGGPGGMMGPGQKAKDFKVTFRRLIRYLHPHRGALLVVLLTAVLSTVFSILGPKILGNATTKLFEGLMAKKMASQAQPSTSTPSGRFCSRSSCSMSLARCSATFSNTLWLA